MERGKDKILRLILGFDTDGNRISTLQLALKQARRIVGMNSGETLSQSRFILRRSKVNQNQEELVDNFFEAHSDEEMDVLTSLSLYLIVLDQLGHIFGELSGKSNRVRDAIDISHLTANMTDTELDAIKDLRNSINHNFGLASYRPSKCEGGIKYTICFDDNGNLMPVVDSLEKWDGDWSDKNEKTSVQVFPFSLINFVEDILKSFIDLYQQGNIDSPLSTEELATRFTIIVCDHEENKAESLSTFVTEKDLADAWIDENGVEYSADRKRLLRAPQQLTRYTTLDETEIICNRAFEACYSLLTITISSGVKTIGTEAFGACNSLESVCLPDSLIQIKEWAFSGCISLKAITIPSRVKLIERGVFEGCNCEILNKSEYFKSDGFDLYSIKDRQLIYCSTNITKYAIPDSIRIIGEYTFFDCAMLKSIVVPDSVITIENGAFCGCESLLEIKLPKSIRNIGKNALEGCTSLKFICVPEGSKPRFEELLPDYKSIIVEKMRTNDEKIKCDYDDETEEGLSLNSKLFGNKR